MNSRVKVVVTGAAGQIAYSLIGRHNGAQGTLDKCNELGIKVLAYYPFAMGLLTGKYSKQSLATLDDSLTTSSKTSLAHASLRPGASLGARCAAWLVLQASRTLCAWARASAHGMRSGDARVGAQGG